MMGTCHSTPLSDFDPASVIFRPHHRGEIIVSNLGIFLWIAGLVYAVSVWGYFEVMRVYFIPYLWYVVNPMHVLLFLGLTFLS